MKTYKAKLSHDNGTFTIKTCASSKEAATEIIMKAEGCPRNAIISIRKI